MTLEDKLLDRLEKLAIELHQEKMSAKYYESKCNHLETCIQNREAQLKEVRNLHTQLVTRTKELEKKLSRKRVKQKGKQ